MQTAEQKNLYNRKRYAEMRLAGPRSEAPSRYFAALAAVASKRENCNLGYSELKTEMVRLWEAQKGRCYWSGLPLTTFRFLGGKRCPTNASIDRIDPTKPYEIGNLALVCFRVNNMKSDMSPLEFVEMCRRVLKQAEFTVPNPW